MIFQDLIDLGVNPRIAVALNRMVVANHSKLPKSATEEGLASAIKAARGSLCDSIANRWAKVAKGKSKSDSGGGGSSYAPSGGFGGGGSCFVEGSEISTKTGTMPIEALSYGSKVLGFNENTGTVCSVTVEKILSSPVEQYLQISVGDTKVRVTESHPLLTRTGWVEAGNIRAGDSLLEILGGMKVSSEVRSIEIIEHPANVYVMEMKEAPHTYIVDGLVAHNAKIDEDEHEAVKAEGPEPSEEEEIRKDERKIAEWTVKLGYALAKHLGADEITALTASMYAFTNIPDSREVSSQVLKAEWWPNGRPQRQ